MSSGPVVGPLEPSWQEVVDAVLRARGAPALADVARLGPRLVELSRVYNAGLAGSRHRAPLEARIAFSFARDVPKGAASVRELVAAGLLAPRDRPLRIVDLGAGLGAMTWGIARAVAAASPGANATFEALLVDDDRDALAAAEVIAREARTRLGTRAPALDVRTRVERLAPGMKLPEADVVVLGQVLSELDTDLAPEERVAKHVALVSDLLDRVVSRDGALVIVEPALRDRARHLHAVRDALVASARTVFAPCLHAGTCPALAADGEWCHDDLAVDLPAWLVPLARAAGLRFQRLTFSHLVLRRDARTLRDASAGATDERGKLHLRVVSDVLVTKGKAELFACTSAGARVRLRRLDRDVRRGEEDRWIALGRGDVVTLSSAGEPVDERGRIHSAVAIDVWPTRK